MTRELKPAIVIFLLLTAVCGGLYPAAVTAVATVAFPRQAAGSLVVEGGRVRGSSLIGQPFSDPRYFWPRPSATAVFGYNPLASGGANLGPTNPALLRSVAERVAALRAAGLAGEVPSDLVLASASGLDPHVSPAGADAQVARVARARGLGEDAVRRLVESRVEGRQLGFLGEPRVNVLELNLALDRLARGAGARP